MMRGLGSLSKAMVLGFIRDRTALFFTVLFPLMFLVLFGTLFKDAGVSKASVIEIGSVPVLDSLPADASTELGRTLKIDKANDLAGSLEKVRRGDYAAAIEQQGNTVIVHYSAADAVRAGTVRTALRFVVQNQNQAATGVAPRFDVRDEQVEDKSLKTIQYLTPGLLGWAIATGATFGAALTLVTWRQKLILRRLRLSPVTAPAVFGARIAVSLGVALVQAAIFIGVASLPFFGLKLATYWWMVIPLIIAGTLAFLSLGLLAGAWAKTQESASAVVNLVVLPMAFLSGSFFPLDNAPSWLRSISEILPLKHLNKAMLDVMVRDRPPASVLPQLGLLLGFALVVSLIASRLFRWDDV
jgi:ABC-2 type transport system permease protein